jgi:ribose-phosphate pyrophosphokinase
VSDEFAIFTGTANPPDIVVAAIHGLFVPDARKKLSHPAVREVLVTDTICVPERDWPQLHVITIAPLIADALGRLMADGSLGELY